MDSLQPRWRLLGRGQGVGAVPLQSHLGLGLWQARLQAGVQLLGQHLQGHCVLVVVGALLCFQLGRGRRLVAFPLERVPHLWQQDVDNLLLRWLDNECVISSDKQLELVFDPYLFAFFIGICVKNSTLYFLKFPFHFWLKKSQFHNTAYLVFLSCSKNCQSCQSCQICLQLGIRCWSSLITEWLSHLYLWQSFCKDFFGPGRQHRVSKSPKVLRIWGRMGGPGPGTTIS